MEFYDLDVQSTININGEDTAFDYNNIYLNFDDANAETEKLKINNDVLSISIHKWILLPDGTQEHTGEVLYSYINKNHRELSA